MVYSWISRTSISMQLTAKAIVTVAAVVLLSLLSQLVIPLPFTPVMITGQTFGVTLVALLLGRKLGSISFFAYLALGIAGLGVFANGKSGLPLGPTGGYLLGMMISTLVVGTLADRGFTESFKKAFIAGAIGSLIVHTLGLIFLEKALPGEQTLAELLTLGSLPFLPGDLIKTTLAAGLASSLTKAARR